MYSQEKTDDSKRKSKYTVCKKHQGHIFFHKLAKWRNKVIIDFTYGLQYCFTT